MSTINLLPEDYLKRRWQNRANVLCIILFGVVMVGVGAAAMVSEQNLGHTREIRDRVDASYAEAAKQLTEMQQLQSTKRQMVTKAMATASLLERVPRSYLLAVVARALPMNCSLVRVDLKPGRAKRQAPSRKSKKGSKFDAVKGKSKAQAAPVAPPMKLEVTGLAATDVEVANFIKNLQDNPLMTSVNLRFSQNTILKGMDKDDPDSQAREFKVTMEIRPNVDVIDLLDLDAKNKSAQAAPSKAAEGARS